jgi:hypothetical protein
LPGWRCSLFNSCNAINVSRHCANTLHTATTKQTEYQWLIQTSPLKYAFLWMQLKWRWRDTETEGGMCSAIFWNVCHSYPNNVVYRFNPSLWVHCGCYGGRSFFFETRDCKLYMECKNLNSVAYFPSLKGKTISFWDHHALWLCVCVCLHPFQILNPLTYLYRTWYECYATGGNPNAIFFDLPLSNNKAGAQPCEWKWH